MLRHKTQVLTNSELVACVLANDVTGFPRLVDQLHRIIGSAWGHLSLDDSAAYLSHSAQKKPQFLVLALAQQDLMDIAKLQNICRLSVACDCPVILVSNVASSQLAQALPDDFSPLAVLDAQSMAHGLERAVSRLLLQSQWSQGTDSSATTGRVIMLQSLASGSGASLIAQEVANSLSAGGDPVSLVRFLDESENCSDAQHSRVATSLTEVQLPNTGGAGMARHLQKVATEYVEQGQQVVVSMPPQLISAAADLVPLADTFFAVAEITPRAAQNTRILRRVMADAALSLQDVRFILNRLGDDARSLRRSREMAAALCIEFSHIVPDAGRLSDRGGFRSGETFVSALGGILAHVSQLTQRKYQAA
jgi:Flp pilus assembly CpaE family ATPase